MPQKQDIKEVTHTYKKSLSYYRAAIQTCRLLYGEPTFHDEKKNVNTPLSNIAAC